MKLAYDYSQLAGAITTKFGTQLNFANAMGLSERSISLKMNNQVGWKQGEMVKACSLLGIPFASIHEYFFTLKVQN